MRGLASLLVASTSLLAWSIAHAQETASAGSGAGPGAVPSSPLVIDYRVTARQEFVDNFGFSNRSTWITSVGPGATVRMDSETLKVAGSVALNTVHYSNEQAGKSRTSEPRFSFASTLLRERSTYGVAASYFRDQSFLSTVPDGPGFQQLNNRRTYASISPNYSYQITQRLSASANYNYLNISYSRPSASTPDADSHSLGGGMQYRLTELDTVGVSVSTTKYSTTPQTTESESRSVQISWNRQWSERTIFSSYLGVSESQVSGRSNQVICIVDVFFCLIGQVPFQTVTVGTTSSSTSPTYGFTLTTQLTPVTTLGVQINRGVQAGSATPVDREVMSVDLSRRFSDRLSGNIDYTHQKTEFIGTSRASQAIVLQSFSANLGYGLGDNWSLNAGARVSQASFTTGNPQSRAVFLAITKTWPNNRLWP